MLLYSGRIGIWRCWLENLRKPSEDGANQQQIQPTYGTGPESNPGHISGKRVLSPLRRISCSSPGERTARTVMLI